MSADQSNSIPSLPEASHVSVPKWIVVALFGSLLTVAGAGFAAAWAFTVESARVETRNQMRADKLEASLAKLETQLIQIQATQSANSSNRFTDSDGRALKQEIFVLIAEIRGAIHEHRNLEGHPKGMAILEGVLRRVERIERKLDKH